MEGGKNLAQTSGNVPANNKTIHNMPVRRKWELQRHLTALHVLPDHSSEQSQHCEAMSRDAVNQIFRWHA